LIGRIFIYRPTSKLPVSDPEGKVVFVLPPMPIPNGGRLY
jgi:hypothetical protein